MTKEKDIFTYGYDKYIYKQILTVESPLVYNQVDDRLSQLIPANQTINAPPNGLDVVET